MKRREHHSSLKLKQSVKTSTVFIDIRMFQLVISLHLQNKNAANLSLLQLHREQLQNQNDDLNTRCQCYKTFFLRHGWRGLISYRVWPWKPFPVRSWNLRARPEPTQLERLSGASFLGKLLVLPANVRLDWKAIARYKHSGLFGLVVSNERNKFYNINTSMNSSIMICSRVGVDVMDGLEMIPDYHSTDLTQVCPSCLAVRLLIKLD
jgi:hypothetical protein